MAARKKDESPEIEKDPGPTQNPEATDEAGDSDEREALAIWYKADIAKRVRESKVSRLEMMAASVHVDIDTAKIVAGLPAAKMADPGQRSAVIRAWVKIRLELAQEIIRQATDVIEAI